MSENENCPTCGNVRQYPFCINKYHDDNTKNNPAYDALKEVLDRLGFDAP